MKSDLLEIWVRLFNLVLHKLLFDIKSIISSSLFNCLLSSNFNDFILSLYPPPFLVCESFASAGTFASRGTFASAGTFASRGTFASA